MRRARLLVPNVWIRYVDNRSAIDRRKADFSLIPEPERRLEPKIIPLAGRELTYRQLWYVAGRQRDVMGETRKLAAILVADVVGYSRLAGADEEGTVARLRALRCDLIDPSIALHHGRSVKWTGDGSIIEFRSVVNAVRCALQVQTGMVERNMGVPPKSRIEFRVGIHLGDVVEEADGDLMGDGINIAARLEGIAEPGGIVLSGAAYEQARDRVKEPFVDLGETTLKNIARPVRVYALKSSAATPVIAAKAEKPEPRRLSLVVLPFANIGGDPEQEYFADGVTESLTTDLSRIAGAFVIGRSTAFTYKGKAVDLKRIGRELNVRYVLEGSVQRAGNRMRVNVQLIEAETGAHLWAERFDKPVADIFDMQDEIVSSLANRLGQELAVAEARRAERAATPNSMDHYFLGLAQSNKGVTAEIFDKARSHYDRAIELDQNNVEALIGRTWIDLFSATNYLSNNRVELFRSAEARLGKVLKLSSSNANAHCALGVLRMYTNRATQGIAECERALAIDRNLAAAHAWHSQTFSTPSNRFRCASVTNQLLINAVWADCSDRDKRRPLKQVAAQNPYKTLLPGKLPLKASS